MKIGTYLTVWILIAIAPPLLAQEPASQLEDDWLFQADGQPTVEICKRQLASTDQLAKRLARSTNPPNLKPYLTALAGLNKQLTALGDRPGNAATTKLYLAIRRVKRGIGQTAVCV